MYIKTKIPEVGTRVQLKDGYNISLISGTFFGPHDFEIVSIGERGWDLRDGYGRMIHECLFEQDKFEIL